MPVYPGDVIVADEDGAIVVPRHLADEVARDSFEQERLEKFVAIRVGQGMPITGIYPPNDETKALYQAWIKAGEPATAKRLAPPRIEMAERQRRTGFQGLDGDIAAHLANDAEDPGACRRGTAGSGRDRATTISRK